MAYDLATRLREVREAHSLSQRALAKSTGISNATISLIESSKLNPSVAVLKRILEGIPMGLSAFFAAEATEPTTPVVYASEDLVEIARGHIQEDLRRQQLALPGAEEAYRRRLTGAWAEMDWHLCVEQRRRYMAPVDEEGAETT
ncbi:MAG: helix-turn-helix domain-containing protein, partial [bacterium]